MPPDDPSREPRFRPLEEADLPQLHRWLNEPAVVRWWEGADVSWPAVLERYGPGGSPGIEHWIALLEGAPMGWIQCFTAAAFADGEAYHWRPHLPLEATGGIDYLVGEPGARGQGAGSALIRTFARDVAFARHPEWRYVAAGPFTANVPSCRALEKAGFRPIAELDDEDGPCTLFAATRAAVGASPDGT